MRDGSGQAHRLAGPDGFVRRQTHRQRGDRILHVPRQVHVLGDGAGHEQHENHLHWRNLADQDWPTFIEQLIQGLPTDAIWITIDKDVLASEDAATNWDQGGLPLGHLLAALRRVGNWAMRTRTSAPSGTSGDSARMVNTS